MEDADPRFPYVHPDGKYFYLPANHDRIQTAGRVAQEYSLDKVMPVGVVIFNSLGLSVAYGANGSTYHDHHPCERVRLGCKTGEGYELCEGCHPKNHAEAKAIVQAASRQISLDGCEAVMFGHFWACKPCWEKLVSVGVRRIYLVDEAWVLFNRAVPGNLVEGNRQFTLLRS